METKLDCKSYFTGYSNYYHNSMRDLNEDSSTSSWPTCYSGNNTTTNGAYYNGFVPRAVVNGYQDHGKDALKQKMLEHEAVFKNQVYELHRVYRIQMDMMEEFKRKELYRVQASMEPSSSSNFRSQIPSQDPRKWHTVGFPPINSGYENQTSISRVEIENSPMSCTKGYNTTKLSKDYEISNFRPLKVRKRLIDLQLPADEYIDTEESEKKVSSGIRLADLNKPIEIEESMALSTVDFLDQNPINGLRRVENRDRPFAKLLDNERGFNEREWISHLHEAGPSKSNLGYVTHGHHTAPGMLNRALDPGPLLGSYFASQAQSVASLANPVSSFAQKLTTTESSRLDLPRNLHTLTQIEEKWLVNGSSRLNPVFGGEIAAKNGLDHGSTSKNDHVFRNNSKPMMEIDLNEAEYIADLNQPLSDCEIIETASKETQNVNKIPGFPIFQMDKMCMSSEKRNGVMRIDINLECEPQDEEIPPNELTVEKGVKKETFICGHIDLNSCVSDFEEENDSSVKIASGVEAPAENEDIEASFQLLQTEKKETLNAAEIMIAISSPHPKVVSTCPLDDDPTLSKSLIKFVDFVLDEVVKEKSTDGNQLEIEEKDDFEEMTLLIRETKVEDYMPTPFVSEEVGPTTKSVLGTRPRRGQSRRGRQRKDFQRDILPGLVSLSRLEVTEDIQTFGGLMRATGHNWVSGLARKNGGDRCRRRASGKGLNNRARNEGFEGGGIEDRKLTGWGKTTRRPRRQRCSTRVVI